MIFSSFGKRGWNANLAILVLLLVTHACHGLKALAYYFIDESLPSLTREIHRLDEIALDIFAIDGRGNVKGRTPRAAMNAARTNNKTKVFLCVSNYGPNDFNGPRVHAVLKSRRFRNRLIANLVRMARNQKYDGVNVDFEAIPKVDRGRYTAFIKLLSQRLRAKKLKLAVSVPALERDEPKNSWSGAFNYAALGRYVDILQIMTYDEHGPWDPENPGPVAGLDWIKRCMNYTLSVVPAAKISFGIPAYGYVYNLKTLKGESIAWKDLAQVTTGRTVKWHSASSSPYVEWVENGDNMVAWIENTQSIQLKAQYARSIPDLHGVSVWALAHEDALFWDALLN